MVSGSMAPSFLQSSMRLEARVCPFLPLKVWDLLQAGHGPYSACLALSFSTSVGLSSPFLSLIFSLFPVKALILPLLFGLIFGGGGMSNHGDCTWRLSTVSPINVERAVYCALIWSRRSAVPVTWMVHSLASGDDAQTLAKDLGTSFTSCLTAAADSTS